MGNTECGAKVSAFSRFLASLLAVFCVLAFVLIILSLVRHKALGDIRGVILLFAGLPLAFALVAYVAFTGRSPRWMARLESALSEKVGGQLDSSRSVETMWRMARLGAVVAYGTLVIALGVYFKILSSATSWGGIAIFAVGWFVTLTLIWQYFGRRISNRKSRTPRPR